MKTALQLYTIRNTLLADIPGHLSQLKKMGYDGAEICNFGGDSVSVIAGEMKKVGLEVFSIHTDINEITAADCRERVERYASLGCRYMTIGWLPGERLYGGPLYAETLDGIKTFSAVCRAYGICLLYHNHDFDFDTVNGAHKLDMLYADTDKEVLCAELDTCWVYSGGEDPLTYLEKYAGRCPVLHLKDCVKEGGRQGFRALGEGVLKFDPILSVAPACGVEWLCVEQDEPTPGRTPLECAGTSIDYLRARLP